MRRRITFLALGLLAGCPLHANAGILIEQAVGTPTVTYTQVQLIGETINKYIIPSATEIVGSLTASGSWSSYITANVSTYYATVPYQLWWEQTSSTETPPSTVYCHEVVNADAAWTWSAIGINASFMLFTKGAVSNTTPSISLETDSGLVQEPVNGALSNNNTAYASGSKSIANAVSWTYAYTLPSGLKVYKSNATLSVTTPKMSLLNHAASTSGNASGSISSLSGFGLSCPFFLTP